MIPQLIAALTTVLALAGLGYYLLALWSARSFSRAARRPLPAFAPPVSLLKPVRGIDPEMYESFCSHCTQNYPGSYEILFGVSSIDDPAVASIYRLQAEFPDREIHLVLCPELLGANGKVSNLIQMIPHARYPYLLINDSDIRVSRRYLSRVMARFAGSASDFGADFGEGPIPIPSPSLNNGMRPVGMVTAPYRGRSHRTLGSRLEALGISTDFIPGVLTSGKIERGIHFGLGSTLAFSRQALAAIGGLEPLVDYLADDYELGVRISRSGFEVVLADEVVETYVPAYNFAGFIAHQLRWARSTRDSRKLGYAGLGFTFGLPWAICNAIACGLSLPSLALLSLVLVARYALAFAVGVGVLADVQVLRDAWLIPLRDCIAVGIWVWSFAGDRVAWRGQHFSLKDGKLLRLPSL